MATGERPTRLKVIAISFFCGFAFCSLVFWAVFEGRLRINSDEKQSTGTPVPYPAPSSEMNRVANVNKFRFTVGCPRRGSRSTRGRSIDQIGASIPELVSLIKDAVETPVDPSEIPLSDPFKMAVVKLEDVSSGTSWCLYLVRWNSGGIVWTPEPAVGEPFDRSNHRGVYQSVPDAILELAWPLAMLDSERPERRRPTTQESDSQEKAMTVEYSNLLRRACQAAFPSSAPASQPHGS